ncbi:MAG: thiamine-phosphate kinase, partial [Bacteroidota bacterium]
MLEDKNTSRTPLDQLGEFELIRHLTKDFELSHPSSLKGIGDDAAVLDLSDKKT